jgi:hypothetical protein
MSTASHNAANAKSRHVGNDTENQRILCRPTRSLFATGGDVLLGVAICYLLTGTPVPDVNEAHYLAKAKHYWQTDWCHGDIFLESADTHLVFYWSLGWLTAWLPLTTTAWVLRIGIWTFLCWSMSRLVQTVSPGPFRGAWAIGLFTLLMMNFHMAGEWVVGGAEAKGVAYGFVLLGLEALCRGKWNRTWCLLGIASAFHVLVGGWSVIAGLIAWTLSGEDRISIRKMLPGLLVGGAVAMLGLIPALNTTSASTDVTVSAHNIYVYKRLPHHLAVHRIAPWFRLRLIALAVLSFALAWPLRKNTSVRRLAGFTVGATAIAFAGLAIDQALLRDLDRAAWILRFYWYRLADFAIPLFAAMIILHWQRSLAMRSPKRATLVLAIAILTPIGWWVSHRKSPIARRIPAADRQTLLHHMTDEQAGEAQYLAWRQCCDWVQTNTPSDAIFVTPWTQQTFKFYAHRGEVANWKDIPQDANAIVQWNTRIGRLYPPRVRTGGLVRHRDAHLARLAIGFGADYILVRRRSYSRQLDPEQFQRVYPNRQNPNPFFQVLKVVEAEGPHHDK